MLKIFSSLKKFVFRNRRVLLAIVFLSLIIYFGFLKYVEIFYTSELFKVHMDLLADDLIENYNFMYMMGFMVGSCLSVIVFLLCSWVCYSISDNLFNLIEGFKETKI